MGIFRQSRTASPSTKEELVDEEFGVVSYRRVPHTKYIRVKINQTGKLSASLPPGASLQSVRELIDESRDELRNLVKTASPSGTTYTNNMRIGASHTLTIASAQTTVPKSRINGQHITVWLPTGMAETQEKAQSHIRTVVKKALTKEAKSYLPRRLAYIAETHGFSYESVRFSNAKGRWGSCSSRGTISLNVALMRLDRQLIDYVLTHELCHTRHMNHSSDFWDEVASIMPNYRQLKKLLKAETPYL
jgi:predicted metal-dependent hydrolase